MKLTNSISQSSIINDYYQVKQFKVNLGEQQLSVVAKACLPGWEQPDPVISLITAIFPAESQIKHTHRLLVLGSGNGTLAAYLARLSPTAQIWATNSTALSIVLTSQTALVNNLHNIQVFPDLKDPDSYLSQPGTEKFDTTIILLPKGRKVARRWLLHAYQCLSDTGILYLAGANNEGIQAVAKDVSELIGPANILGYKKGTRLYRFTKERFEGNLPDWCHEPGISPGTWKEFNYEIHNHAYIIHTLPGVFSYDHIDEGTRMLLECMEIPTGSDVLDIGCGCGIIGIHAASLGAGYVHLADNHLSSIVSTLENLRLNHISDASVYASDLYAGLPDSKYDMIFSNPPFHSGKAVDYQVAQALIAHGNLKLNRGGSLIIVANRFIRYEHMMRQIFGNVKVLQEDTKYHVLCSEKL